MRGSKSESSDGVEGVGVAGLGEEEARSPVNDTFWTL